MNKIYEMLTDIKPEHDFNTSSNFIEDGLLDSFDIISLISMLEDSFGITIDGLDIVPENFYDISAIVSLVIKSGGTVDR